LHGEAGGLKAEGQAGEVVDSEFDFGFDGHGKSQLSAFSSQLWVFQPQLLA
jgi:hypothetical protein